LDARYKQIKNEWTAIGVWTRYVEDGKVEFYGIQLRSRDQKKRMHTFFRNQVLIIMGASPTPPIQKTLPQLFDKCRSIMGWTNVKKIGRDHSICYSDPSSSAATATDWHELEALDDWVLVMRGSFYPNDHGHGCYTHSISPGTTVITKLVEILKLSNGSIRNLGNDPLSFAVLIEHPIAHIQTQDLLAGNYEYTVNLQNKWTQVFLNATQDPILQDKAKAQGVKISRLIAFDGSPQFFPSVSGGHMCTIRSFSSEKAFLEAGGYEGWKPEYGSTCRGFLPPTSELSQFAKLARVQYENNGLDMLYYGRVWEFINLVWFGMKGWTNKGLDCTHGGGGVSQMHKYFLMAMVDGVFDQM